MKESIEKEVELHRIMCEVKEYATGCGCEEYCVDLLKLVEALRYYMRKNVINQALDMILEEDDNDPATQLPDEDKP